MTKKAAEKLEKDFNNTLEIIKEYNITGTLIGTWLGITRSAVSAKLNGISYDKFSDNQKLTIISKLKELRKRLAVLG
jgi:predicted transcriptional regulator